MSKLARNLAVLSLGALTLPSLVGCEEQPSSPTKPSEAYPNSLPVRQGSPNQLETDINAFVADHTKFVGQRIQLPINESQVTFIEQRQLYPSDDGSLLYVYDLALGARATKYRIFATRDIDGAAAISGTWSKFGNSNYLAADSVLVQRVDNGDQSWLWKSFSAPPPPTGVPALVAPPHP